MAYFVVCGYKNTGARLEAYIAWFTSGIGDLAMGVNVRKRSHDIESVCAPKSLCPRSTRDNIEAEKDEA